MATQKKKKNGNGSEIKREIRGEIWREKGRLRNADGGEKIRT